MLLRFISVFLLYLLKPLKDLLLWFGGLIDLSRIYAISNSSGLRLRDEILWFHLWGKCFPIGCNLHLFCYWHLLTWSSSTLMMKDLVGIAPTIPWATRACQFSIKFLCDVTNRTRCTFLLKNRLASLNGGTTLWRSAVHKWLLRSSLEIAFFVSNLFAVKAELPMVSFVASGLVFEGFGVHFLKVTFRMCSSI